jgi:RimJ/RimL family protein N-acetyltransferase
MELASVRLTARLRLEPISPQHAESLWRLLQDPAVAAWYGDWTREMARREAARIAGLWVTDGVHKWMAYDRLTGDLIGRGGLSWVQLEGRNRLEIGWVLHGRYWGHGYATEIGHAGIALAFEELDEAEIVSYTEARNTRSRAVMERLGFQFNHEFTHGDPGEPFVLYVLRRPG